MRRSCLGLIALPAGALQKGEFHAYDMELRTSSLFTRHDSEAKEELCAWPGPETSWHIRPDPREGNLQCATRGLDGSSRTRFLLPGAPP